ncbi:MAG TPA: hypothetical protein VGU20_32460 [Stellaceae bacterium]|nr:hypothetical protein [Stellaceae bacterium]
MRRSPWLIVGLWLVAVARPAAAESCAVQIGNGGDVVLISVTVRAEFAPPGSAADHNLSVALPRELAKNEVVAIRWECPSSNISYTATGMFRNGITATTEPFKPQPMFPSGVLDTAWLR